jgi:DNA-binding XRE family transcriptional regulator|nr:MAG TPA: helix-turn-helix domain protein [Caudoviricetes sp.]
MTDILTPVGLRCRRKALGMSRADLAALAKVNEGAIRSWEIGKSWPRDPLSIHMMLGAVEDEALACVDDLTAPADDEIEDVRVIPTALIAYVDQASYEQGCEWAGRLPLSTYQACVGRAFALLSDQDIPVEIITRTSKEA